MKTNILFITVLISLASCHLDAQTAQDIAKWNNLIINKELPEIAQSMESSGPMRWPQLTSNASQALKAKDSYKPSDLGQCLFEKIRSYENHVSHKEADSESAAKVYISLSRRFQDSGGYVNLCLADAVNRLAIARLSEILINNPDSTQRIKGLLVSSTNFYFSKEDFVKMIHAEPAQAIKPGINLDALQDKDVELQILAALGSSPGETFDKFGYNQAGTSTLINGLQIGVLLERMIVTDVLTNVDALGLVDFFDRGGKYKDLNYADIRPFKAIMKGDEMLYKSDLAHIDRVRVSNLVPFIDEFRNAASSVTVKLALQ